MQEKADALHAVEGSSPLCATASLRETSRRRLRLCRARPESETRACKRVCQAWHVLPTAKLLNMFGGVSFSAIAKMNEKFSAKIKKDRALRKTADKISRKVAYVKG